MIVEGTIKQYPDGKIRPVTDPNESEQIRSQCRQVNIDILFKNGFDKIRADAIEEKTCKMLKQD